MLLAFPDGDAPAAEAPIAALADAAAGAARRRRRAAAAPALAAPRAPARRAAAPAVRAAPMLSADDLYRIGCSLEETDPVHAERTYRQAAGARPGPRRRAHQPRPPAARGGRAGRGGGALPARRSSVRARRRDGDLQPGGGDRGPGARSTRRWQQYERAVPSTARTPTRTTTPPACTRRRASTRRPSATCAPIAS